MGEAKEILFLQMSQIHGKEMPIYFVLIKTCFIVTRKEGEKVKHEEEKNPKIALFGLTLKKPAHPFSSAWSLLLVHVRFTPRSRAQRL